MSNNFQEHPDESVAIRFLDGELTEREAAELRSHLDGCWQCRRNLGEWQGTIDAFLRLRESVLFAADPPPPNPWLPLDELYPPRAAQATARWWNFWKLAAVTAAIALAVFAAAIAFRVPAEPKKTAPPPPPSVLVLPPTARPTPVSAAPPAVQPEEVQPSPLHNQVLAARVLHELDADLGEPVAVVPSATHAIVRAKGLDRRRRQAIQAALEKLPGVAFENSEPGTEARRAAPAAPTVSQAPRPKLFEAELLKRLGSPAAVESFANSVLDDGDAVAMRAHAIQALDSLFPDGAPLSPPDRVIIDTIVSEHRAVLRRHVQSLRARLQPILDGVPGPSADAAPLSMRAIELDRLLNAAFAGAQVSLTDAELAARIQFLLKELAQ